MVWPPRFGRISERRANVGNDAAWLERALSLRIENVILMDIAGEDDDLTSLNWLQNLNILPKVSQVEPPIPVATTKKVKSRPPAAKRARRPHKSVQHADLERKVLVHRSSDIPKFYSSFKRLQLHMDFKNDAVRRPPFSYAALICLALMDTRHKMTLNDIYDWIRHTFAFYRETKPSSRWQVRLLLPVLAFTSLYCTFFQLCAIVRPF